MLCRFKRFYRDISVQNEKLPFLLSAHSNRSCTQVPTNMASLLDPPDRNLSLRTARRSHVIPVAIVVPDTRVFGKSVMKFLLVLSKMQVFALPEAEIKK